MFKKVLILLLAIALKYHNSAAQYTDDAPENTDSTGTSEVKSLINLKDNGVKGMEFMLNGGNGFFYGELSPFVGYYIAKPLLLGAGVHGSVLVGNKAEPYYGGHVFARLIIAEQLFIHGEYNLLNGDVPGLKTGRIWVTSPIVGIGMMNGGSWAMIGYASNPDYQQINPFGRVVYRIGFYF